MPIFDNGGQMGFMPGESYGMPNQMGGFGGLLSNKLDDPLLQLGLGILANNNSKNTGQVLGRGALQGIQNIQQARGLAQQRKLQDYQMKDYERKQSEYDRQQKALADFKAKFHEYGEAVELDPKLAIKAAYPALASNSADPYYTPIATESGLGSFNNRSGKFELVMGANGHPVVKSADSPTIRGAVKDAEAAATAGYRINDKVPGLVTTDRNLATQINPALPQPANGSIPAQPMPTNNFNTPYPVTFGAPGTTATDLAEGTMTDASVGVRNPSRPNVQGSYAPPVSGIRVPTPAEQAGLTETAKKQAENDVNMATDQKKNVKKADQFLSVAQQAKQLLNSKENPPTSSGIGAAVDAAGNLIGVAPKGAETASQLEAISGWMVSNVPRMEGPQSNFDVQNYQTMAGMVGDRTKPLSVRRGALEQVIKLQEKYKALNQGVQGNQQDSSTPQAMALPAKPSTLTLKKGTVYATPKGNLTWNGKAFED